MITLLAAFALGIIFQSLLHVAEDIDLIDDLVKFGMSQLG
jgi:hypothetical protein